MSHPDGAMPCLAVLPPGLEAMGADELAALGASAVQPLRRAVRCRLDRAAFYRVHLQARLPFRVLRELAVFPCRNRDDLHEGVQRAADWNRWLPPQTSLRVDASGSLPGLNHSHYTALQVKNALIDWQRRQWGERSSIDLDDPDLSLHLHLSPGGPGSEAHATISLDGSGGSLHRRGYRSRMGLAPLKENLAAGLIALSGWDGTVPLVDPLCGSGTLLIEAACRALALPAGLMRDGGGAWRPRTFGFERWPDFDPQLFQEEVRQAEAALGAAPSRALPPLVGRELDPTVLEQARENAEAAGLATRITLESGDLRDLMPPAGPGLVVCNPPYGERVGETDALAALYADLGALLKERFSGWTLWLLSGNPELTGALRMKASRRIPVSNGGIDCRWLRYDIR
jgi:putative N6-adenine-specific DNA methylase